MYGVGLQEIAILAVIGTIGIGGVAALYFVVRAAVRDGNRDAKQDK